MNVNFDTVNTPDDAMPPSTYPRLEVASAQRRVFLPSEHLKVEHDVYTLALVDNIVKRTRHLFHH